MRAGTRPSLIGLLALALALAACSSTADPTTTTTSTTTAPSTTTSSVETTTTSSTSTTTTSSLPDGTVGDPALLLQKIEEGSVGLEGEFGLDPAVVPVPDLTNPDPLIAMREIIDFDLWVFSNAPRRGLIEVYVVDRSPEWEDLVLATDRMNSGKFRFAPGDGLEVSELGYANDEHIASIPQDDLDAAPEGSVIVYYVYSIDPFEILNFDGSVLRTNDGWTNRLVVGVLSPTARGWALYWEEGFGG